MANLTSIYTCAICNQLFDEATSLKRCNHIFCWKCIHDKITQHDWQMCPVCGVEFGPDPLRRLSHDDPLLVALETNIDIYEDDDDEDNDDDDDEDEDEDEDEDDDEDEDEDMDENAFTVCDGSNDEKKESVDETNVSAEEKKECVDEKQVSVDEKESDVEEKEMSKKRKCDDGEGKEMGSKDSK